MIFLLVWIVLAVITAKWLRQRFSFFQRLNDFNWQLLVLIDIIAAFVIFWPIYLIGIFKERPLAWTTISTMCGYYSVQGKGWAIWGERVIDGAFKFLTGQLHHCLESYLRWKDPLDGQ